MHLSSPLLKYLENSEGSLSVLRKNELKLLDMQDILYILFVIVVALVIVVANTAVYNA